MRAHTILLSLGLLAGVGYGQTVILSVTGPQALAEAGEKFELRYGIPVSYEDANYAYDGDLETDPEYVKSHPGPIPPARIVPKGGPLELRGDPKGAPPLLARGVHSVQDAMPLLQSLVDDHGKAGYPGQFALIQSGDGVAIVPVAVKDVHGTLVPDQSLLETRITLPLARRNGEEVWEAICEAIRSSSGKNILSGDNQFSIHYSVTVQATNEPARTVIERALAGFESSPGARIPKAAWSLKYVPGLKMYFLHLRQVLMELPTPAGGKTKRPVFR